MKPKEGDSMQHGKKCEQKHNNIVLIGFMGCGKTTVGLRLSYRFRRALEDTDKIIEKREKRRISDIFAVEGEEFFREIETELLQELADNCSNKILSVGGGTPIREENRKLIKKIGIVFYLRVQPETVYERLKGDTTRPLLQGDDPLEKIKTLLSKRQKIYEETADIVIDVDKLTIEEVVDCIERNITKERTE